MRAYVHAFVQGAVVLLLMMCVKVQFSGFKLRRGREEHELFVCVLCEMMICAPLSSYDRYAEGAKIITCQSSVPVLFAVVGVYLPSEMGYDSNGKVRMRRTRVELMNMSEHAHSSQHSYQSTRQTHTALLIHMRAR